MNFLAAIDLRYVLSGFCVGGLIGITGIGGGSLMTPLLILVFGVSPATAVGTDLLFASVTKTVGTLVHGAARNIEWRIVGLLASGSVPAAILTLAVVSRLEHNEATARHLIAPAVAVVLFFTAIFLLSTRLFRARYAERAGRLDRRTAALLTIALGFLMGSLVTFTSIGAGAIGVTTLLLLYPRLSFSRIVGSDIAHAVPLTLVAGAGHWVLGSVDQMMLCMLLTGSIPGIIVGSYLAPRAPDGAIRIALAILLLGSAIKLVW